MTLTNEKRSEIGIAAVAAMDFWSLTDKQKLTLLKLEIKPRFLSQVAQGTLPLPEDNEILERARHILGIAGALHNFFPLNNKGGSIWLKNTNKYFLEKSPLECMLQDGLRGMHKVWVNLDCTQGWD